MKRTLIIIWFVSLILNACSQKKMSDRDRKLQERQQSIDVKKNELTPLAGVYFGLLTGVNDYKQNIKLTLEIKEVPESENKTDSTIIPKFGGSLRFLYGPENLNEYVDCSIKSAEYNKLTQQLTVIVTNHQFNELILSGTLNDSISLNGSWSASSVGVSGKFELIKEQQ